MTTHHAPPVDYPLGRSRFQGVLLLVCWAGGGVGLLGWAGMAVGMPERVLLALGLWLAAGATAAWAWRLSPVGRLAWDGSVWRWESAGYRTGSAGYTLEAVADFQQVLLLRLENQAHARLWLWAERRALPERWLDLRRAIYSPLRMAAGTAVDPDILLATRPAVAVSDHAIANDATSLKP